MTERKKPFVDIDIKRQKQELAKQFRVTINNLAKLIRNPREKEIILSFTNLLGQSKVPSIADLPYYDPKNPMSVHANKTECVLSMLSFAIREWWNYQEVLYDITEESTSTDYTKYIQDIINELNRICSDGLNKYNSPEPPLSLALSSIINI